MGPLPHHVFRKDLQAYSMFASLQAESLRDPYRSKMPSRSPGTLPLIKTLRLKPSTLNQLREDTSAWQVCLSIFARTPRPSEVVRHVALEIVNHAVQNGQLDEQSLAFLKDSLMEYIRRVYGSHGKREDGDTITIQNKLTQTVTYLFTTLYATSWELL
jgi:exportin-T